eukprot:2745004-Alexandrium_andersonii.AAC.1
MALEAALRRDLSQLRAEVLAMRAQGRAATERVVAASPMAPPFEAGAQATPGLAQAIRRDAPVHIRDP